MGFVFFWFHLWWKWRTVFSSSPLHRIQAESTGTGWLPSGWEESSWSGRASLWPMQMCLRGCWNEAASSTQGSGTPTQAPFLPLLPALRCRPLQVSACQTLAFGLVLPSHSLYNQGSGDCRHLQMLSLPFEALRDSLHWHKSKARERIHLARQKNPTVIMSHTGVYSFNSFILFLLRKELFQGTHSIVYISHFIFHRREKKPFHTWLILPLNTRGAEHVLALGHPSAI